MEKISIAMQFELNICSNIKDTKIKAKKNEIFH